MVGIRLLNRRTLCLTLAAYAAHRATASAPDSIPWLHDYAAAHRIRVNEGRPMLIFLTMESCPHCHRMLQSTYQDRTISAEIKRQFVPAVVNGTDNQELARRFRVRIYPTTIVVAPNNHILDRIEGFQTAEQLRERLADASRRLAAMPSSAKTR